jgi:hypothetical protein
LDIISDDYHVRWSLLKETCQNVDEDLQQQDSLFISHRPYTFHRGALVDGVRRILTNVKPIDIQRQDKLATKRYQAANRARILFQRE